MNLLLDPPPDSPLHAVPPPSAPLHVLEIVGNAIVGGMERCVERLVAGLGQGGAFRFTVACPSEGGFADRIRAAGAQVVVVAMPEDPPWTSIQLVASLITAERVDLVHAHMPHAHLLGGLAARLAGVPVITTIHARQVVLADFEIHRQVGSHLSVVCRQSYYHALGLGVSPERLSCETNGVDVELFQPGPRSGNGPRAALGIPDDALLVGFLGRLSPEKAPELFVRAAASLLPRLPGVHAVLVGEGPMAASLRAAIDQSGLGARLHLAGGIDDVRPALHDLDLLVSSSLTEAMPLALMEGMACGVPVVATRVGGVPEIVAHGMTGWLVEPRDPEDLAGRMYQMLTQPALRVQMGLAARERMQRSFRLDLAHERLAARLRSVAQPVALASSSMAVTRVPRVAAGTSGGRKGR